MIKALIVAIALLSLAACGGNAPRPTRADAPSFSIISEQEDPATGGANVVIKFPKSTLPRQVKAAAESLIASRRTQYRQVTVKSFLDGTNPNGVPFAVSRIENDSVDTVFNAGPGRSPAPGESVRIPTH
jgi:predicted small lipoprotein YifL